MGVKQIKAAMIGILRLPDGRRRLRDMLLRSSSSYRTKGMGVEFRKMIITLLEFSFWIAGSSLGLGSITHDKTLSQLIYLILNFSFIYREYALSRKAKEETTSSIYDIAEQIGVVSSHEKPIDSDILFWRLSEAAISEQQFANLIEGIMMLTLEHAYWVCRVEAIWGVVLEEWLDATILSCRIQLSIAARDKEYDLQHFDQILAKDCIHRELLSSPRMHDIIRNPGGRGVKRQAKAGDARLHFATAKHLSPRHWNNASSNSHMRSVLYKCGLAEAIAQVYSKSTVLPRFTDHDIGTIGESMIVELEPALSHAFVGLILHDAQ